MMGRADRERFLSAVDEAERAGMVCPRESGRGFRYEFTHDLIRHALLAGLSELRRREMHTHVVECMEALYPEVDAYAAEVVSHLERAASAADAEKMLRYSVLAAEKALEAAASEDALRHLERAMTLVPEHDRRTYARLLYLRGYTLRALLRWEEALRDWQAAVPLFEELRDADSLARTCKDMAIMAQWQNRVDEAIGLAERGLALVGEELTRQRVHLLCHAGLGHSGAHRFQEGDQILAEAEAVARHLQDPECLGAVLFYRSVSAMFQMRVQEQLDLAQRSVALLRGTSNLWDFVPALEWIHMALFCLGRWREMGGLEPEIERIAERTGHVGTTMLLQRTRAYRKLLESPDLESFGAEARAHLEVGDRTGFPWAQIDARLRLGQLAWWRGDFKQSEALLRESRDLEIVLPEIGTAVAGHVLLLAQLGDLRALDILAVHEKLLPEIGRPAGIGCWKLLLAAVESLALLGKVDRAAAMHPVVLHAMAFTGALIPCWSWTSLSRIAGISAAAAGQWDEASAHLDRAWDECQQLPNRFERPFVLRWRAWTLARRGRSRDARRARELLAEAQSRCLEIGIDPRVMGTDAPQAG
jgi:tetratricopeptide (TPR) repeat protein